ncbi:MAG TPA: VWA domain-containing protein [Thermoanaerobaculia bacterium]|nr:VWA domain-containing protein [Thermoanaerobaculia bacterium]
MNRTIRAVALSMLAALTIGGAAFAQDAQRGEFGEEVTVNEVLLDVLVTDNKGNVVVGLNEDDFVVKEGGKPVDLTGITFYSSNRLTESPESLAQKGIRGVDTAPEDRYFILFFQDQKNAASEAPVLLTKQMEANQRAREWIGELGLHDHVAVAGYDQKLKIYQDFTTDKAALVRALGQAMKGKELESWPSRQQQAQGPSILDTLPTGKELRNQTTNIYDAIRVLAEATADIRGRKNLLLFTPGFGVVRTGQLRPDLRYYPDMADALNDANVAVYPIDLVPEGARPALNETLNQIAEDTGGQYLFSFVNFITPLRQIGDENGGYYLLSYRSEHPAGKSGFQKVEVDTANPQFRIRTREGYSYGSGK